MYKCVAAKSRVFLLCMVRLLIIEQKVGSNVDSLPFATSTKSEEILKDELYVVSH